MIQYNTLDLVENKTILHLNLRMNDLYKTYINASINKENFLVDKLFLRYGEYNSRHSYVGLKLQWDTQKNIKYIRVITKQAKDVIINRVINMQYTRDNKLISYEDSNGNYWNNKEFTIPNPYKLNGLGSLVKEFHMEIINALENQFDIHEPLSEYKELLEHLTQNHRLYRIAKDSALNKPLDVF